MGIGLAQRQDMTETTFLDIYDFHEFAMFHFRNEKEGSTTEEEESVLSALSVLSVGLGAVTMVGGQAIGARGLIEGLVRITDLLTNEVSRKWAAPLIGALVLGTTGYFILELPNSIPRTVGRRIKTSLAEHGREPAYVDVQVLRVARETRKVLRLAAWDLRQKFSSAMEESGKEVRTAEATEKKAKRAREYFNEVAERAGEARVAAMMGNDL